MLREIKRKSNQPKDNKYLIKNSNLHQVIKQEREEKN